MATDRPEGEGGQPTGGKRAGDADKAPQDRPGKEREGRSGEQRSGRERVLRGIARRILGEEPGATDELFEGEVDEESRTRLEAKAILGALLETGDKAKTETVRMVAREVRGYLEALELHKDLHHLLTNYSLEVKASIHLAPLDDARRAEGADASVGLKRKPADGGSSDDAEQG